MNDVSSAFETSHLSKRFGATLALDDVSLRLVRGSVAGLVGKNGSGKTTLFRCLAGLALPSGGVSRVLGKESGELGDEDLARIGLVQQESRFLPWMRVRQHLDYVGSFYERWDEARARRLLGELELDESARIGTLSPGNAQKLALISAVCHRPLLLFLDEPVSALDPIARETLFRFLLDLLREDGTTIVISSHALRDVERVVDWIVCLEGGRIVVDAALDDLRERYAEWRVVAKNGGLPARFDEPFVLEQRGDPSQALLCVRDAGAYQDAFAKKYQADVEVAPLNLERMFPLWVEGGRA